MNFNRLIKNISKIYEGSINSHNKRQASFHGLGVNNINDAIDKLKESLKNDFIPENIKASIKTSIVSLQSQAEKCTAIEKKNSYSHNQADADIDKLSENYEKTVKSFTDSGGKGFYDMHNVIIFDKHGSHYMDRYLEQIKNLQDLGYDIQVVFANKYNSDEYLARTVAVVMPSSIFNAYQESLEKNIPEMVEKGFDRKNYVCSVSHGLSIPSLTYPQNNYIEELEQNIARHLKNRDLSPHRAISMAIDRHTLATVKFPYSGFNYGTWQHEKDALKLAIGISPNYTNKKYHCNGISPTCYFYDEKLETRINMVNDVDNYKKENNLEKDNDSSLSL